MYRNDYWIKIWFVEINLATRITKIYLNSTNDKFTISDNKRKSDEAKAVFVTVVAPHALKESKGFIAHL